MRNIRSCSTPNNGYSQATSAHGWWHARYRASGRSSTDETTDKTLVSAPLRLLIVASLLWLLPLLACGSFAPRPTPTPTTMSPVDNFSTPTNPAIAPTLAVAQITPLPLIATNTAAPEPTLAPTSAAPTGTGLQAGQPARVTAPAGLNMRTNPASSAGLILQLATGIRVTVVEGPTTADNFTWWRVDDGQGNVGWVADGDAETVWLSPQVGEVQPVDRAPRVGDRVAVTMPDNGQLSVRVSPGTNATLVARVNAGEQMTVINGPQQAGGFTWYQVRSDNGGVEGWAAAGDGATRWLSPLE